jgi:hypoxanthine-DNA glycosylase
MIGDPWAVNKHENFLDHGIYQGIYWQKSEQGGDGFAMRVTHPIAPVYDAKSRILILGSFPSVKSREQQFFYGHKQNRFWRVLAYVLECQVPQTIPEKRDMLLEHHIAVWDVIASCEIEGSADASIQEVQPNDLSGLLAFADIQAIYTNGGKAFELYQKYMYPLNGIPAHKLPSTSPANAGYSLERLDDAWMQIREYLDGDFGI